MNTIYPAQSGAPKVPTPGAWTLFQRECIALAQALASPRRLVAQVERMRELQLQAQRVQASDPARAAALRRAAARCLQS